MEIYFRDNELARYNWIVKIPVKPCQDFVSFKSPNFFNTDSSEIEWCLILKTRAEEKKTYVSLHLQSINHNFIFCSPMIKLTLGIIYPSLWNTSRSSTIIYNVKKNKLYGFEKFLCLEELGIFDFKIQCIIEEVKQNFAHSRLLQNDKQSSDLHLLFNGTKYLAHKFVLAVNSLYFRKVFASIENTFEIEIEDMEFDVFCATMNYMYSGKICDIFQKDCEKIRSLFEVASRYKILGLMRKCCPIMIKNLSLKNVVSNLLACKLKLESSFLLVYTEILDDLTNQCIDLMKYKFKTFMEEKLYQELLDKEPRFLIYFLIEISKYLEKNSTKKTSVQAKVFCKEEFESFGKFINNKAFSDIEIHVGNKKYFAHKVFLAGKSQVFCSMFSHSMKETILGVVEIEDVEPRVFEKLLRFAYTNEFDPKDGLTEELLVAADKYEIIDLKRNCEDNLIERLTRQDVIGTLMLADNYFAYRLKETCIEFIANADSACFNNDFIIQFKENLLELIKTHPHLFLKILHQVYASSRVTLPR